MNKQLSICHKALVMVVGGDEGTNHYECTECHQPCDLYKRRKYIQQGYHGYFKKHTHTFTMETTELISLALGVLITISIYLFVLYKLGGYSVK